MHRNEETRCGHHRHATRDLREILRETEGGQGGGAYISVWLTVFPVPDLLPVPILEWDGELGRDFLAALGVVARGALAVRCTDAARTAHMAATSPITRARRNGVHAPRRPHWEGARVLHARFVATERERPERKRQTERDRKAESTCSGECTRVRRVEKSLCVCVRVCCVPISVHLKGRKSKDSYAITLKRARAHAHTLTHTHTHAHTHARICTHAA